MAAGWVAGMRGCGGVGGGCWGRVEGVWGWYVGVGGWVYLSDDDDSRGRWWLVAITTPTPQPHGTTTHTTLHTPT